MSRRKFGRVGRAAMFAFGATVAMGTASCIAAYGTPAPDDAGSDAGMPESDAGGPAPAYGGAPAD